jgi:hypothetical protein
VSRQEQTGTEQIAIGKESTGIFNFAMGARLEYLREISIGVIASIVFLALERLVRGWLWPTLRARFAHVPNLDKSKWRGWPDEKVRGKEPESTMEMSQIGDRIRAVVRRRVREGERVFSYEGRFQSGQIVLTWEELGGEGYITGAMVLHLSADRKKLDGLSVYYRHSEGKVVASYRLYERIS